MPVRLSKHSVRSAFKEGRVHLQALSCALRRIGTRAVCVAVSCAIASPSLMCGVVPMTALAEGSVQPAQSEQTQQQETVGLNGLWDVQAGANITQGGVYKLEQDLVAHSSLCVDIPKGEKATVDLNGFNLTVEGNLDAAVSIADCAGDVVICDNKANEKPGFIETLLNGGKEVDSPKSILTLRAQNAASSVSVVRVRQTEGAAFGSVELHDVELRCAVNAAAADENDAQTVCAYGVSAEHANATAAKSKKEVGAQKAKSKNAPSVVVDGCSFKIAQAGAQNAQGKEFEWAEFCETGKSSVDCYGPACALYSDGMGFKLKGAFKSVLASNAGTSDLYSFEEDAFAFSKSFACSNESLSVYEFGAAEAAVVAQAANRQRAKELASLMVDPTQNGHFEASGKKLLYQTNDAEDGVQEAASGMRVMAKKNTKNKAKKNTASTQKSKCLNKAWKNKASKFTITKAGTYYLSEDLELEENGSLEVSAPKADVVIDLRGYTIDSALDYTPGTSFNVTAAKSVTFKNGTINCSNSATFVGLTLRGEKTKATLNKVKIKCAMDERYPSFITASMRALAVYGGSLTAANCEFDVDLTGMYDMTGVKVDDVPIAVYVAGGSSTSSVSIRNSKIKAKSTSTITTAASDSYWGGGQNAYALKSDTMSPVALEGCELSCASPHASAFGVSASNLTLNGINNIELCASAKAFGVCSTTEAGVKLAGKVNMSYAGLSKPVLKAALYSPVSGGFKLMKGFAATNDLDVVAGDQGFENTEGTVLATFDKSFPKAQRIAAAAGFANPLASLAPCTVGLENGKVAFLTDTVHAKAVLESGGISRSYSTATAAARFAKSGDTISLNENAARIVFDSADEAKKLILDLNGHTASSLVHADSSVLCVVNSSAQGGIVSQNGANCAVTQSGAGTLSLTGVSITSKAAATASYGVRVTGDGGLELDACSVEVSSQAADSVGVEVVGSASGDVSLIDCKLDIWTSAASTACYGVLDQANQGALSVAGGSIKLETVKGAATGISCKQSASIKGSNTGKLDISAVTQQRASSATGIVGTSSNASFDIRDCSISVGAQDGIDTSGADYWCLVSGAVNVQSAVGWTLRQGCSFKSANDTVLLQGAKPINLANDFSLDSGQQVTVGSGQVPSNMLANCLGDAQKFAELFKATDSSFYDSSWKLAVSDSNNSALEWQHEDVAQLGASAYPSVQEALAAAKDSDTVKLLANVNTNAPISISSSITFDLNGHTLTVDTASKGSSAAVTCQGAKSDVIIKNGSIKALLGGKDDSALKGTNGYRAVASSAQSLSLQDLKVDAAYAGTFSKQTDFSLYGVYQSGGEVVIGSRANVSVRSNAGMGSDGHAQYLYGVYVASGQSMVVDGGAAINVENSAQAYLGGDIYTTGVGSSAVKDMALERVDPPHDSDLYKEIYARFKKFAVLDKDSSSGFGSRVYYVESIPLSDGSYAWAYSKPVPVGKEGGEYCKPDLIFTQAKHTVLPSAYGVSSLDTNTARITVKGTVSTNSAQGDAIALRAYDKAKWSVEAATLKARSGVETVARQVTDRAIDLRDFFDDVPYTGDKTLFFPSVGSYYQLKYSKQRAWGIHADETVELTLGGDVSISTNGGDAADVVAPSLKTDESFALVDSQKISLGSEEGVNSSGEVAVSGDAKLNTAWFEDAYGGHNLKLAADGDLVWSDLFSASFYNGELLVASYEDLQQGTNVNLPDPAAMAKSEHLDESYTFLGWSEDPHAREAQIAADAGAVTVTANVSYYAVYATTPLSIKCTFENLRGSQGRLLEDASITCRAKATIRKGSSQSVPVQSDYSYKGETYRFIGWKTSTPDGSCIIDAQDLEDSLVLDYSIAGVTSGNAVFTAVFARVSQGEHLVTFKSDYTVDYGIFKDGEIPAYNKCVSAKNVSPAKSAAKTGCDYILSGWHSGSLAFGEQDGATVDFEDGATLPVVNGDASYTACFKEMIGKTYIEFYYWHLVDGVYKYAVSEELTFDYGADINEEVSKLVKLGDTFSQDGTDYVFAGWSPRAQDVEPVYTDDLPLSTGTVNTRTRSMVFYGIYKKGDQKVQVTFHDGDEVYATADATAADSVKEAFALTGKGNPPDKSEKLKFLGWSSSSSATQVDVAGSATLARAAGGKSTLDLYAVYGSLTNVTVTFVDSDHKTVLGAEKVKAFSTISQSGCTIPRPSKKGSYFKGWVTSSGQGFDLKSDSVVTDVELFAQYGKLTSDVQEGLKAKLSLDAACFSDDAAMGKSVVKFSLYKVEDISTDLLKLVKNKGDSIIGDAIYRGLFKAGGEAVETATGLGKVALSLPVGTVSSRAKVRAYWVDADGNLRASKIVNASDGKVSLKLSSYSSFGNAGNIVVAQVSNKRTAELNTGKTHSGSIGTHGNNKLPVSSGAALAAGSGKGRVKAAVANATGATEAAKSENQPAAVSAMNGQNGITEDDLRVISDIPNEQQVAQAYLTIAGSPVIWLLALLLSTLVAFVFYRIFVARKREVFEEAPAGWSDEEALAARATASDVRAGDLEV